MKKRMYSTLVCMLFLGITTNLYAQFNINVVNANEVLKAEAIDDVLFTAQYELNFIIDTLHPDKKTDETMMLKVGKKSSVFYSYARFMTDSLIEIDKKTGADIELIHTHMQHYTSNVGSPLYNNYPAVKTT
mgnify:CR=1 FL=1